MATHPLRCSKDNSRTFTIEIEEVKGDRSIPSITASSEAIQPRRRYHIWCTMNRHYIGCFNELDTSSA